VFHTLVVSADFGNSVLAGLSVDLARWFQLVLNVAAWLTYLRRSNHITDALWLVHTGIEVDGDKCRRRLRRQCGQAFSLSPLPVRTRASSVQDHSPARRNISDHQKPVHTVAEKCDSRRISPLSRRFRWQSHFSATVSLFWDSLSFLRQCGQGFSRVARIWNDSVRPMWCLLIHTSWTLANLF